MFFLHCFERVRKPSPLFKAHFLLWLGAHFGLVEDNIEILHLISLWKKILISFFISVMNVRAFKATPTPCPSMPCKQRTMKQTGWTSSLHGSLGFLRRRENPSGAISKQIFPRQMPHSEKHLLFSGNVSNPSGISLLWPNQPNKDR